MKIIGYRKSEFDTQDGKHISGYNIYCTYPLEHGEGEGCDRLFLTMDKLAACGYTPVVGDSIKVEYNRFGKPAALEPVG